MKIGTVLHVETTILLVELNASSVKLSSQVVSLLAVEAALEADLVPEVDQEAVEELQEVVLVEVDSTALLERRPPSNKLAS